MLAKITVMHTVGLSRCNGKQHSPMLNNAGVNSLTAVGMKDLQSSVTVKNILQCFKCIFKSVIYHKYLFKHGTHFLVNQPTAFELSKFV